ncbi:MAG: hypothetical protein RL701_1629 [Pseudomonadota bacterium]
MLRSIDTLFTPAKLAAGCFALALVGACGSTDEDNSGNPDPITTAGSGGASNAGKGGQTAGKGGSLATAGSGAGGAAGSAVPAAPTVPPADGWKLTPSESKNTGAWDSDCEQYFAFKAHGKTEVNDTSKYSIPTGTEYYESFFFTAPWGEDEVQSLEFRPLIDNARVVHHWILYGANSSNFVNGSMQGGPTQLLPTTIGGEAFVNGWAPGGQPLVLPKNVGLYMPRGQKATFRLEVHYNNNAGDTAESDSSGVEFCVTKKKREQEAATHWLGTANISIPAHGTKDVSSTCVPKITAGPVHVMGISPHMHQTGVHAKVMLNHADGTSQSLIDAPFAFADQKVIKMPQDGSADDILINAGDSIATTCTYDNQTNSTITFGENTGNEMCFFFTLAWPRGQLMNGSFTIVPGAERSVNCLQ